eukprot:6179016-Pleurochrysis_carterae.AAC.3
MAIHVRRQHSSAACSALTRPAAPATGRPCAGGRARHRTSTPPEPPPPGLPVVCVSTIPLAVGDSKVLPSDGRRISFGTQVLLLGNCVLAHPSNTE